MEGLVEEGNELGKEYNELYEEMRSAYSPKLNPEPCREERTRYLNCKDEAEDPLLQCVSELDRFSKCSKQL